MDKGLIMRIASNGMTREEKLALIRKGGLL